MKKDQSEPGLLANRKFRALIFALIAVIPLEILSLTGVELPLALKWAVYAAIAVIFGYPVFKRGLRSLIRLNFADINLLVLIANVGALYLGKLEEAAIILVLFSLGDVMEEYGLERSQSALKALVDNSPKTVTLKDSAAKVPLEQVKVGQIFIVRPGDAIALDGRIVTGQSLIDEAAITGEPLPKTKTVGELVFAGTHNGNGYLEIEVTKAAKDTTLAKIIELTFQALEKKSKSQRFIEKFAAVYTPLMLLVAIALVVVPVFVLGQPLDRWLTEALTLLLIACPCALVISTPISVFSALGSASGRGILIKGGRFLEEMAKIKAVAMDKTRTLTEGKPVVSDVVVFDGMDRNELLACVAGAEALSEHPIAESVVEYARTNGLSNHGHKQFVAVAGKGIATQCLICDTKEHAVGNLAFIAKNHRVDPAVSEAVAKLEGEGKTAVIAGSGGRIQGVIGISDRLRDEAVAAVSAIKSLSITPVMLTGDNRSAALSIGQSVGIDEVKAELLPQDKSRELADLMSQYGSVAMIGDGVNDAPALAASSVGIAMGAVGSDVAIENADIALMKDDLSTLPYLVKLGRQTVKTIRLNTTLAIGVKAVFLVLAILGMSNLTMAIAADVGVTVLVTFLGLRLLNFQFS